MCAIYDKESPILIYIVYWVYQSVFINLSVYQWVYIEWCFKKNIFIEKIIHFLTPHTFFVFIQTVTSCSVVGFVCVEQSKWINNFGPLCIYLNEHTDTNILRKLVCESYNKNIFDTLHIYITCLKKRNIIHIIIGN